MKLIIWSISSSALVSISLSVISFGQYDPHIMVESFTPALNLMFILGDVERGVVSEIMIPAAPFDLITLFEGINPRLLFEAGHLYVWGVLITISHPVSYITQTALAMLFCLMISKLNVTKEVKY